jgi:hypothetical protein
MSAAVDFSIRCSSTRFSVTPSKVHLNAGQSIVVTVKLFLNHYPAAARGDKGIDDYLHIKSTYFDNKIPIEIFVNATRTTSRSPSPSSGRIRNDSKNSPDVLQELRMQVELKDKKISDMENLIGRLTAYTLYIYICLCYLWEYPLVCLFS